MRIFAFIAYLICAPVFAASCHDEGSQPGVFPLADEAKLVSMLAKLQKAVYANDQKTVADSVAFPLAANADNKHRKLSRKEFLAHYDDLVTEQVRGAIADARFQSQTDHACVFWNAHGFMLGDGEVWINDDATGELKIVTINH